MSILRCPSCERFVDTDDEEMLEVNGRDVCENCAEEAEEMAVPETPDVTDAVEAARQLAALYDAYMGDDASDDDIAEYNDQSRELGGTVARAYLALASRMQSDNARLRADDGAPGCASAKPSDAQQESGPEFLQRLGMDAAKWCAEMVKVGVVTADPAPGEQFHGWMCNAIMAAYDIGHAAGERRITNDQLLPLLRKALLIPRPWMVGSRNHPKAVTMAEWTDAVDSVCNVIDQARDSWVDPDSKEARDERAAIAKAEGPPASSPSDAVASPTEPAKQQERT